MVDPNTPPTPSGDPAAQPPEAAGAASSSTPPAHDATASLDRSPPAAANVVSLQEAAALRRAVEEGVDVSDSHHTPHPQENAQALTSGDRGEPPGGESAPDKPAEKPRKAEKTVDWGKFNHLAEHFVLIYGTDTVWDGSERIIMKIANMGHAHGSDMVRMWKGSERRRTVRQQDVVFDPTMKADPATTVNLFDGLAMEPDPCESADVQPMLDLIRFLTSRASDSADECDEVMHWLLCWLAVAPAWHRLTSDRLRRYLRNGRQDQALRMGMRRLRQRWRKQPAWPSWAGASFSRTRSCSS